MTGSVMRNAHSGLPKCSSQLYEMDMPISALHGGLEENGWYDHISLYMCMEYSRIQKKLKRVWRKKKQINWTVEAQYG